MPEVSNINIGFFTILSIKMGIVQNQYILVHPITDWIAERNIPKFLIDPTKLITKQSQYVNGTFDV